MSSTSEGHLSVADRVRAVVPTVSVGLLTADLCALGNSVREIGDTGVSVLHFDVMDGQFCPLLTFGVPIVKAVKTSLLKDVHLIIENPLPHVPAFAAAGADMLTVHVEACRHPHRVLQVIGEQKNANDPARGILRGMALNPGTPMEMLDPLLDEVDYVCLVMVNPGWSGQKMISSAARRVERLKEMIRKSGRDILIGVDGGVTQDNVDQVVKMGADLIVAGSAIFDGKTPAANAKRMLATIAAVSRR